MKKLSILFLMTVILGACDVMDQDPISDFSEKNFWKTADDARAGLNAAYDGLQEALGSESSNFILWGDARADEFIVAMGGSNRTNEPALVNNTVNPTLSVTNWDKFYSAINRANLVLKFVPTLADTRLDAERNKIIGEAYYIRAIAYFYLVRIWGEVPIIREAYTSPTQDFQVFRAPVNEVYAFILEDLQKASELLPKTLATTMDETYRSRANIWAVRALRVDVALTLGWRENSSQYFQQAADTASLVINQNRFQLESNYMKLFQVNDQTTAPRNSSEVIFQLSYNVTSNETNSVSRMFLYASGGGVHVLGPSTKLVNVFEQGDQRDTIIFSGDRIMKYRGSVNPTNPTSTVRVHDNNIYLYRLADMHLMRAEALIKLNQVATAMSDIQKIRERAWVKFTNQVVAPPALPAGPSQDEALTILLNERLREFAAEGKRWFDLARTSRVLSEVPKITNPANILFPVYEGEIRLNRNLTQNEYYR